MKAKQQLKNLTPYKPGKNIEDVKDELGLTDIVKLASNENPFGCSEKVKKVIDEEINQLAVYPDGYASVLRDKTAQLFHVNHDQLIFGNGTDEIIQMICRAFLTEGSNTVMPEPTFPQYKHNAIIEGAQIREIPLKNGMHDLNKMSEAVDENTKIVWLCMINNPSGEYIRETDFISFLESIPSDILVVCDEAYYEYAIAEDYPDTLGLLEQYPNLLLARTFSKIYGLAALRVGYGVGHASLIAEIEPVRQPFNVSRIGQAAAAAALDDQAFIDECRRINRAGLQQIYQFCEDYGLSYYPSQGNFILIDFNQSGDDIFDYLIKHGYIVRSGTALGYPTAIRLTIGSQEHMQGVIECLSTWFRA